MRIEILPLCLCLFATGIAVQAEPSDSKLRPVTSFEQLLEKNLDQHPELRAYQKEIEASHLRGEESFWLGDTSLSVARTGADAPLGGGPSVQTEFGITQNFSWPGKSHSLTRLAEIEAERTRVEFEKRRRQLEKETALLYSRLLSSSQKANIARQKIATLSDAKKITSRNVRSGLGVPVDDNLIEREIELTQLQIDQLGIDQAQKVSEIEAKFPETKIGTSEPPNSILPRSYFRVRTSQASNLTLRAFSLDLDRTLADTSLRRQSVWPDFALNLTRKNEKAYDVTLGLTIPLWYPFRQSKQIGAAANLAQANEMRFDYQKQVAPLTEVLYRSKIQNLRHQVEGRKRIIRTISESTLKQSRALFERGRIDWKQLQLAVDAVFADQEKLVDLDLDLFSAELDLYELLGVME